MVRKQGRKVCFVSPEFFQAIVIIRTFSDVLKISSESIFFSCGIYSQSFRNMLHLLGTLLRNKPTELLWCLQWICLGYCTRSGTCSVDGLKSSRAMRTNNLINFHLGSDLLEEHSGGIILFEGDKWTYMRYHTPPSGGPDKKHNLFH